MPRPVRIMYTTEDANAGILLNQIMDQEHAQEQIGERGALEEAVGQLIRTVSQVVRMLRGQARLGIGGGLGVNGAAGDTNGTGNNAALDLGPTQVRVLYALIRSEMPAGVLAKQFNISLPAMARIIDPLVERGYLERTAAEGDKRAAPLRLTPAGSELAQAMRAQFSQALKTYLSPLSEQQLYEIVQACSHLVSLLPSTEADELSV